MVASDFDLILDECIRRLSRGDTVEDCLASYPQVQADLEPQLRLIARLARAYDFTPSLASKVRGRERVIAELRALERRRVAARVPWRPAMFRWPPRWAAAVVSLIVIMLASGAATVAAAGGALPGEALYPVKRAAEQARLSTEFSQPAKVQLHVQHAERRAEEINKLVRRGRFAEVEATQRNLSENLADAAAIAMASGDDLSLARLRSRLEKSASQALAGLQVALQAAPEASRQAASDSFQASSESYGEAVEAMAARAPERHAAAKSGLLRLVASDPPPPGVEKLVLEVKDIRVHLAGPEGRWITVNEGPLSLDLVRIARVQKLLGEREVEPGIYTKVRFRITEATAVAGGVEYKVKVPSGSLNLVRPFRVQEDQTTVVTIDFDGARSLRLMGQGDFILTPAARVLAREPVERQEKEGREDSRKRDKKQEETRDARSQPADTEPPVVRAEIEGTVESLAEDSLVVSSRHISIGRDTRIDGTLELGARVRVEAIIKPAEASAIAIEVLEAKGPGRQDATPKVDARDTKPADETRRDGAAQRQVRVEIKGRIDELAAYRWVVKGQGVALSNETTVEGTPGVGATVEVEGIRQPDGTLLAVEIRVRGIPRGGDEEKRPGRTPTPAFTPTPLPLSTATSTPKKRAPTPTSTPKPASTPKPTRTPTPTLVRFEGVVESIEGLAWRIAGREVTVSAQTEIEGLPLAGSRVKVGGVLKEDGTVMATKIVMLARPGVPRLPGASPGE